MWLAILGLAVLNGILREKVLMPGLGTTSAFLASGIVLSACILAVALLAAPWFGRLPASQWLLIGLFWLILTLIFEFGFGRFAQHKSWSELLEAYTFKGGNLWLLVLGVTLISPWLAARLRGLL